MNTKELIKTASILFADDKGLLAMDERNPTCNRRFAALGITQNAETRRAYREMIVTTKGLGKCISGVILCDETIRQQTKDGTPIIKIITNAGIIPGIKVDMRAKDLAGHKGDIVSDGRMLTGCNNTAGEIGHMTIDLHGPECHCGNNGCFEALAGGWAIERNAQEMVRTDMKRGKVLLAIAGNDISKITAKTVSEAGDKHDPLAKIIIDNLADALIAGATAIVNAYAPCRIIFGGGIMEGIPRLLKKIEKGVNKYALKAATENLKVLPAKLHNDSGVIGAAAFALHSIDKT